MSAPRVPVTLLAGFLGSGKTTLLNRLLAGEHGRRVAVIVNEFGDVNVDARLVKRREEDLVQLENGCLCCTVREDLRTTLLDLAARRRRRWLGRARFDRVVIEASGMASPGPAVQTLLVDGALVEAFEPAGVVTLCHAAHVAEQLAEHPEAADQVAYADLLILNHLDRVGPGERAEAERALRACNAAAPLVSTTRAELDLGLVLDLAPLAERPTAPDCGHDHAPGEACAHVHHSSGVGTVTLRAGEALEREAFTLWLAFLARREGLELLRAKGIVAFAGDPRAHVVQAVHQWTEVTPTDEPAGDSLLVLIGRGLDRAELERGWAAVASGVAGPRGGG